MVATLERRVSKVTTAGLDVILAEMLQQGQSILLLGPPFSGKTTLGIQFLISGLNEGERGIIITTNDTPGGIRKKASALGCDLREYEDRNELLFIDCYSKTVGALQDDSPAVLNAGVGEEHFNSISGVVLGFWREGSRVRLVFDSLSTLFYYNDLQAVARYLHVLLGRLKSINATSMLTLESGIHEEAVNALIRSFCDGVLQLSTDAEKHYVQGIFKDRFFGNVPLEISRNSARTKYTNNRSV